MGHQLGVWCQAVRHRLPVPSIHGTGQFDQWQSIPNADESIRPLARQRRGPKPGEKRCTAASHGRTARRQRARTNTPYRSNDIQHVYEQPPLQRTRPDGWCTRLGDRQRQRQLPRPEQLSGERLITPGIQSENPARRVWSCPRRNTGGESKNGEDSNERFGDCLIHEPHPSPHNGRLSHDCRARSMR